MNTYFICFMGRQLHDPSASSSSSFMTSSFLIQILKMDKRLFKNWVLHIPHRLRDLLSMVRAWSSVAPIFSSLNMSQASSSSQSLLKVITSFWHTFLAWMDSWFWEAIQYGYHHFCILHFFFYYYKLSFDLRDPCKVWLYSGSSHSSTVKHLRCL